MAETTSKPPVVIQWILDTRPLWPEATQTRDLEAHAARALALLTDDERAAVLRYYHVRDAKMSLGSHLLKHYVVSRCCGGVPWRETAITRDARTKPVYVDPATGASPVAFNVSHQAGLVVLIAVHGYASGEVDVGVDVVSPAERRDRDHRMVRSADEGGWPGFVDMHASVFAPSEAAFLKHQVLTSVPGGLPRGATPEQVLDAKLRSFYTLWCLREAYVKMTGEALLAEWLGVLEFRKIRPPRPTPAFEMPAREGAEAGEVVREHEIYFRGARVDDAQVCLQAHGPDFITATAVRTPQNKEDGLAMPLGAFDMLSMDEILDYAETRI